MATDSDVVIGLDLKKVIGTGVQGLVYKARRLDTEDTVAVKNIPFKEQDLEKRAKALTKLKEQLDPILEMKHLHLVQHFAHQIVMEPHSYIRGAQQETFQIVMEYCDGGPLSAYVAKNVMPAFLIQKWTQQLLDGLVFLHERRFIHRDIKGSNIVLSSPDADSCNLKLTDLGDVKRIVSEVTKANEVSNEKGTHQFMSPEMVVNLSGNVGRRTDIWSLGCVVIQMVTGRVPRFFQGKTEALEDQTILFLIASGRQPALPSGLPDLLQRFIERCLIIKVEDRPYASALTKDQFLLASDTSDWNMPDRKDLWTVYEEP